MHLQRKYSLFSNEITPLPLAKRLSTIMVRHQFVIHLFTKGVSLKYILTTLLITLFSFNAYAALPTGTYFRFNALDKLEKAGWPEMGPLKPIEIPDEIASPNRDDYILNPKRLPSWESLAKQGTTGRLAAFNGFMAGTYFNTYKESKAKSWNNGGRPLEIFLGDRFWKYKGFYNYYTKYGSIWILTRKNIPFVKERREKYGCYITMIWASKSTCRFTVKHLIDEEYGRVPDPLFTDGRYHYRLKFNSAKIEELDWENLYLANFEEKMHNEKYKGTGKFSLSFRASYETSYFWDVVKLTPEQTPERLYVELFYDFIADITNIWFNKIKKVKSYDDEGYGGKVYGMDYITDEDLKSFIDIYDGLHALNKHAREKNNPAMIAFARTLANYATNHAAYLEKLFGKKELEARLAKIGGKYKSIYPEFP